MVTDDIGQCLRSRFLDGVFCPPDRRPSQADCIMFIISSYAAYAIM